MNILRLKKKIKTTLKIERLTKTLQLISMTRISTFTNVLAKVNLALDSLFLTWTDALRQSSMEWTAAPDRDDAEQVVVVFGLDRGLCGDIGGILNKSLCQNLPRHADIYVFGRRTEKTLRNAGYKVIGAQAFEPMKTTEEIRKFSSTLLRKYLTGAKITCFSILFSVPRLSKDLYLLLWISSSKAC